jgi:hypothetical protein
VPTIVDYSIVQRTAAEIALVSLYHNSGSFGFAPGVATEHVGWIAQPDATLRPGMRDAARQAQPPYPQNLAGAVARAVLLLGPAAVWLLPSSHWAYELRFGGDWVAKLLNQLSIDPANLRDRADGSAIAFAPAEVPILSIAIATMLENLPATNSDFALLTPPLRLVGMVHHHQQIWWTTPDPAIAAALRELPLEA